jgi:23S rRNA pseudouridine1911/1915/1917 synthase
MMRAGSPIDGTVRLDLALIQKHPELSRRKARDVIEKGQVLVDGAAVTSAGHEVAATAAISWDANRKARKRVRSGVPILYEDDRVLVIDKPAGLLAVPTSTEIRDEDTAVARVRDYVAHLRPRQPYVGIVHRLDRDTSGALAFALDRETRHALIELISRHAVERRYLAIVAGDLKTAKGRVDAPIGDAYQGGRRRIAHRSEPSRDAVTHFEVREHLGTVTLVALTLETGRQHQIRLHMAHLGHPVVGDPIYSGEDTPRPGVRVPRLLLHAEWLGFEHPWTGERVHAHSPVPADFERVLGALRRRR